MMAQEKTKKISSFWISPLLVGCCLAAGYEVTHRAMLNKHNQNRPKIKFLSIPHTFSNRKREAFQSSNQGMASGLKTNGNLGNIKPKKAEKKQISKFAELQEAEMQTALEALENNETQDKEMKLKKPKRTRNTPKPKEFPSSNSQLMAREKKFDELFKALLEP